MDDLIIIGVIILIIGLAAWHVIRAKKSGKKCIGCPGGCSCDSRTCAGNCSCCTEKEE